MAKSKSILMSIQPKWVAKILNGEKTIEVRKKFPKDYVGWVYIYCTKGKLPIMEYINRGVHSIITDIKFDKNFKYYLNGKVVARFWCDKVEELECEFWEDPLFDENSCYQAVKLIERDLDYPDEEQLWDYHEMASNEDGYTDEEVYRESNFLQKCCLSLSEIKKYVGIGGETRCFGIHISKLEIFNKPMELNEFRHTCKAEYRGYNRWQPCSKECKNCVCNQLDDEGYSQCFSRLEKAPQSWCYIERE